MKWLLDHFWPVHAGVEELARDLREGSWAFSTLACGRSWAIILSHVQLDVANRVPSRTHVGSILKLGHGGLVELEGLYGSWKLNWRERWLLRSAALTWLGRGRDLAYG